MREQATDNGGRLQPDGEEGERGDEREGGIEREAEATPRGGATAEAGELGSDFSSCHSFQRGFPKETIFVFS